MEKDTPPSVDASESAAKAIQQLYPAHIPLTVEDLSQNENANLMFDQLIKMKEEIQHQQERFDQLKHQIQMHDARCMKGLSLPMARWSGRKPRTLSA